MLQSASTVMKC